MTQTSVETLPVLPLPDGVVFPEMVVTIAVQSAEASAVIAASSDGRILLVPRSGSRFASTGVIASIVDRDTQDNRLPTVTVRAMARAKVGAGVVGSAPVLWVEAVPVTDPDPTPETETLAADYRAAATTLLDKIGSRQLAAALRELTSPGALADSIAYWPELSFEQRIELLEAVDVDQRLALAIGWVKAALADLDVQERIAKEVSEDLEKGQREAILRRQLSAIRSELGEGDEDIIGQYRSKLEKLSALEPGGAGAAVPEATIEAIGREIDRLERTGNESMEANWIRTWLDAVFEIPWLDRSVERLDLNEARTILDADHTGLDDVKDRLVEHLAVRKLRTERNVSDEPADRRRGVILALVGPPGVGKTSLGESVARALGRSFVRLALGGIRDEAEIRGHRRTYVGARPGRLVRALTEAGSMNPVILLDEIDKVSGGIQGDPSAALLEVLDPAQNHSFRDHYLEFELDLSDIVFIATANVLESIPGPLLDRMELITLDGYTESEKAAIATDHLLPRLLRRNGIREGEVVFSDEAITTIAATYTREAGVRRLERLLDKAIRRSALTIAEDPLLQGSITIETDDLRELLGRPIPSEEVENRIDRPGIATGLAVTGAGGDVLFVETALVDGEGEPLLTGQLGDVMKESASIVRSVVSSQGDRFDVSVPTDKRLHVHFPAGAVPKDGPSAGVTMTTALVSLLSGRRVRPDVAMTGEVTLQGRVLPIGGVKQKVLAAHRAGITTVILPEANGADLEDVPDEVRQALTIHLASDVDRVLSIALESVDAPTRD
ncbi:MAG: endopeptidase La [Actinomycetia bacterium]|nr:endopeptidase La [Actinomycetes bacterium]